MSDMLAVVAERPGAFGLSRVPIPVPKRPREALVRVTHAAICGSDVKLLDGKLGTPFPLIPGHEIAGVVEEVHSEGAEYVGQPVVVDILQSCGGCVPCQRDTHHFCQNMVEPGINTDGGFAEFLIARVSSLRAVREVPLDVAPLIEPLSVVLHAVERLEVTPRQSVVIFGGGGIGLLLLQVLRARGVERIALVEPVPERRAVGAKLGATQVMAPDDTLSEALGDWGFFAPEVVFEAAGDLRAFEASLKIVAPRGRVGVIGYPPEGTVPVDPSVFMRKEIEVRGVLSPTYDWDEAVRMVGEGGVNLQAVVTHRPPLSEAISAFDLMRKRASGAVRIVLSCDRGATEGGNP